jgi:FYVE/RhoGEF/PH domain-containing protein 5/6
MDEEKKQERLKKRSYVVLEIISTEKTYYERLQIVSDVYVAPCRNGKILDMQDVQEQFGYWDVICGIHKELYESMVRDQDAGTLQMGALFLKFSHYLKVYKDYLVNFDKALTRRAHLMTMNKKFVELVENGQKDPRSLGIGIESLLIGPVQRIPRYRLLLQELLKYTPEDHEEYESISKSLEKIKEVASENNEAIRQRENLEKIMEIMMKIDSRRRINLLDDPSRKLLREGELHRQCR